MGLYKAPESSVSEENNSSINGVSRASIICFFLAIMLLVYKSGFLSGFFINLEPKIVMVIGLTVISGIFIGIVLGVIGLYKFFRHKNKVTLGFSVIGLGIFLYYLTTTLYVAFLGTMEVMQAH